jgi:peptidoglycan/LPS O-acetylase OafA/YrhL
MRTLEDRWRASRADGNNFDALRLMAAVAVIVSHSFEITGGPGAFEPLRAMTQGETSVGRVAVMTFFVLSGFLLTKSWASDPSPRRFLAKRALRIYPALAAVVLLWVFVLGPLATSVRLADYFASAKTWSYLGNLGFYTGRDGLAGVFSGLPFADVVNGPLWSLKFEILCYATLLGVASLRLLRARATLALVAVFYVVAALGGDGAKSGAAYYIFQYADLARSFFAGSAFALLAPRVPLSALNAAIAAGILLLAAPAGLFGDLFPVLGGYLVFAAAFAPLGPLKHAGRFGDFSYGLYLWGWPAQQIVAATLAPSFWLANAFLAAPLAFAAAALSWRLVERPALALKKSAAPPATLAPDGLILRH